MQVVYCRSVYSFTQLLWVLCLLLIFTGRFTTSFAQSARGFGQASRQADVNLLDLDKDLAAQLMPFENIYELALHNSPLIKQEDAQVETKLANTQTIKWNFLRGLGVTAGLTRGNNSVVTNGNDAYPSLSLSNGYRFGANAGISIGDIVSRGPAIKQAQAEYRSSIAKRDYVVQDLRREVYRLYQATLLSQRMLQLYIQGEQNALVAFQMAEIGWKENRLSPADYASASQTYTQTQARVEAERVALSTNLFDLVTITGVPMARLQHSSR